MYGPKNSNDPLIPLEAAPPLIPLQAVPPPHILEPRHSDTGTYYQVTQADESAPAYPNRDGNGAVALDTLETTVVRPMRSRWDSGYYGSRAGGA